MSSPCFVKKQERTLRQMIAEAPALSSFSPMKPPSGEDASLPVLLLGHPARLALDSGPGLTVLAVFHRSLYCRAAHGALVCIGPPSLGPGPLNILALLPPDLDWQECPVFPGAAVASDGAVLRLTPELRIAFGDAPVWQPVAPPARWGTATLATGLQALASELDRLPPQNGLASFIPSLVTRRMPYPPDSGLARALVQDGGAGRRCAPTLADDRNVALEPPWGLRHPTWSASSVSGPGLTPSGDDLLGGTLIALRTLGWPAAAEALATWSRPRARSDSRHQLCAPLVRGRGTGRRRHS